MNTHRNVDSMTDRNVDSMTENELRGELRALDELSKKGELCANTAAQMQAIKTALREIERAKAR
jgi:hypothetical protein